VLSALYDGGQIEGVLGKADKEEDREEKAEKRERRAPEDQRNTRGSANKSPFCALVLWSLVFYSLRALNK
jgi:hypothetical protein